MAYRYSALCLHKLNLIYVVCGRIGVIHLAENIVWSLFPKSFSL